MQSVDFRIPFNPPSVIKKGKIEVNIRERFEKHEHWKKTKIELNVWDEDLLKIGQYKNIRPRVTLQAKQSFVSVYLFFRFLGLDFVLLQINQIIYPSSKLLAHHKLKRLT